MGKIFYVMGKSASGKDTIYKALRERLPQLKRLIPYTTRPMREGETEGAEYRFTTPEVLDRFAREGKLIEKRVYQTIAGPWTYATVDDGSVDPASPDKYLGIGTLESYEKIRAFFGKENLVPIYIEVEEGERLQRALDRERQQKTPRYAELCRRYLADEADFTEEKLAAAEIGRRYRNDELERCLVEITGDVVRYA